MGIMAMPEKPRIFLCYARHSRPSADLLRDRLIAHDYSVWMDKYDLPGNMHWKKTIRNAIRDCDKLVLVMSDDALQSEWVKYEVETASELNKPILPIVVEQSVSTDELGEEAPAALYISAEDLRDPERMEEVVRNLLITPSQVLRYSKSAKSSPLLTSKRDNPMEHLHSSKPSPIRQVKTVRELTSIQRQYLLWAVGASMFTVLLTVSLVSSIPAFGETNIGRVIALIIGLAAFAGIVYFYESRKAHFEKLTQQQVYEQNKVFFDQLEEELNTLVGRKA